MGLKVRGPEALAEGWGREDIRAAQRVAECLTKMRRGALDLVAAAAEAGREIRAQRERCKESGRPFARWLEGANLRREKASILETIAASADKMAPEELAASLGEGRVSLAQLAQTLRAKDREAKPERPSPAQLVAAVSNTLAGTPLGGTDAEAAREAIARKAVANPDLPEDIRQLYQDGWKARDVPSIEATLALPPAIRKRAMKLDGRRNDLQRLRKIVEEDPAQAERVVAAIEDGAAQTVTGAQRIIALRRGFHREKGVAEIRPYLAEAKDQLAGAAAAARVFKRALVNLYQWAERAAAKAGVQPDDPDWPYSRVQAFHRDADDLDAIVERMEALSPWGVCGLCDGTGKPKGGERGACVDCSGRGWLTFVEWDAAR